MSKAGFTTRDNRGIGEDQRNQPFEYVRRDLVGEAHLTLYSL